MSLHDAVKAGDLEEVRRLLGSGADINGKDTNEYGFTPLHSAVYAHQEPIVALLIERGANIEARDAGGETPLNVAILFGTPTIVKRLIDAGANVNTVSGLKHTPLLSAVHKGDESMVRSLVDMNADVNVESAMGQTPLTMAISRGAVPIVKILLDYGANVNPNLRSVVNETPLHAAVKSGNEQLVRLLLQKGADIRVKNYFGQTALDLPVQTPSMRALLKSIKTREQARAAGEALTVKPIHEIAARLEGTEPAANTTRRYLPPGVPEQITRFLHKKQGGRKTRRKRAYKLSRKRQWRGL